MINPRLATVLAALSLAVGATLVVAAGPATSAPGQVGSVSGSVVGTDGKPVEGAQIRYLPVATAPATAPDPAAGGAPARGGRGARGMGNATSDAKGEFTIKDVPVGQVNITANAMMPDGSRGRGTSAAPVTVKEGADTKLADPIKLAPAPARGGGGAGGAGGGGRRGGGGGAGGGGAGGAGGGAAPAPAGQ